eukprot:scaffold6154_cov218-Skeletonema_menzelii.AAC.1
MSPIMTMFLAFSPGTSRFLRRNKYKSYSGMVYRASTCPTGFVTIRGGAPPGPVIDTSLRLFRPGAPRADEPTDSDSESDDEDEDDDDDDEAGDDEDGENA